MTIKTLPSKSENKLKKVIIVDDHPIIRQGLTALIDHEKDIYVCAQATDAHEAMALIKSEQPDIAIVDISLGDSNGLELIKDLKTHDPDFFILAFSMYEETLYAERALRAGARGYIMKRQCTDYIVDAIRKVLSGQVYLSDAMSNKMVRRFIGSKPEVGESPVECLSDRELEVFLMIGKGVRTRQIAEKLHLSVKTIETYRSHIKEKLNLLNATELLQYAIQWVNS
jgi:DNA-binding NarL/FixJ family response regulator